MSKRFKILCLLFVIAIIISAVINLNTGFLSLSFQDFFQDSAHSQIAEIRINRVLVMMLAGISIPTSGFLMQEYFQNPLAGPDILGITSVASLSVAFYIFFSHTILLPEFLQNSFLSLSAIGGSLLLMFILLSMSNRFQDKSYLIIFGFLVSAFAGAIVSLLQFYAENQSLKNYILWSFGANNMVTRNQIYVLFILVLVGIFICFKAIKPLIGNSLGNSYAQSLGVNLKQLKLLIIVASSLLSASVTAFLGPILFIGIIVPHFCRLVYNPSKLWQQWILNMFLGMLIMLLFSVIAEKTQIPLNVISSVFGIPVILMMLLKQNKV
ncbi:iron complex transport system permease protein [Chryseobacterium bernardetii]|jgi:iron complex transport system permease protein|uniref:Iron complex transport system permease protein n=2 Tax=Chryseobacterium TaxID=59732 RepID=A0A543EIA4_9FLAO|nr:MULTISPECIES: iron ABC transporter permease [Chryseobacterium]MDR6371235.1 iron complex transport system permease protein [Chryseobacterium vietnamense]MDR6441019.1 iron complex transport system permease protein [Chryseobacterium bernardetii]MDR6486474.1 iron complex transport system permease protein [Chryseobacterium vietnamense]TQM21301.1 iron complex transport system permease protein [Chryseobacterium aquifrigidense]